MCLSLRNSGSDHIALRGAYFSCFCSFLFNSSLFSARTSSAVRSRCVVFAFDFFGWTFSFGVVDGRKMLSTAVFHTVDEMTGDCLSVSSDSLLAEKLAMPLTSAVIISILSDTCSIIDNRVSGSSNSTFRPFLYQE